jgi:ketosteroid isomerase-like protein
MRGNPGAILALCISIAGLWTGQALAKDDSSNDVQQLLALERAWNDAEINHDSAALRRLLDDHFVSAFGTGKPVAKDEFIKEMASTTMTSLDPSDATVIVDRDVAVIIDTFTIRGTEKGQPYTAVVRGMETYVKRHGSWVVLAEHFAPA